MALLQMLFQNTVHRPFNPDFLPSLYDLWQSPSPTSPHTLPPLVLYPPTTWTFFPFRKDAKFICASRPTFCFTSVSHASFSIFRSVQMLRTQLREAPLVTLSKTASLTINAVCFLHGTFHYLK